MLRRWRVGPTRDGIALGERAILELLLDEYAIVWPEAEARISNQKWHGRYRVDPNHLLTARNNLVRLGRVARTLPMVTRGGRAVVVYHQPIGVGNKRLVEDAAGRKRLLYTRVTGWATGSARTGHGLMGRAGEVATRTTLNSEELRTLYAPMMPRFAETPFVLGEAVPYGPLDSAAYLFAAPGGVPLRPIILPIEVKNLREWIFPRTPELYQLLAKAATIQLRHPHDSIVPVLVCHRRHIQTLYMAQDLGFFAVETHRQYMLPSAEAPPDSVEEVRRELGYHFLTTDLSADPVLLGVLRGTFPPRAAATAARWASRGAPLADFYDQLRDDRLRSGERDFVLDGMFARAMELPNMAGGWRAASEDMNE